MTAEDFRRLMEQAPRYCNLPTCHYKQPHYLGEFGCVENGEWICPPGKDPFVDGYCPKKDMVTPHRRGCGCDGDPEVCNESR